MLKSVALHMIAKTLGKYMTMNNSRIYEIIRHVESNIIIEVFKMREI